MANKQKDQCMWWATLPETWSPQFNWCFYSGLLCARQCNCSGLRPFLRLTSEETQVAWPMLRLNPVSYLCRRFETNTSSCLRQGCHKTTLFWRLTLELEDLFCRWVCQTQSKVSPLAQLKKLNQREVKLAKQAAWCPLQWCHWTHLQLHWFNHWGSLWSDLRMNVADVDLWNSLSLKCHPLIEECHFQ